MSYVGRLLSVLQAVLSVHVEEQKAGCMRWAELAPSDMGSLPPALTALVKCPPLEAGPNDWL